MEEVCECRCPLGHPTPCDCDCLGSTRSTDMWLESRCASCGYYHAFILSDGLVIEARSFRCPKCYLLDKDTKFTVSVQSVEQ